MFEREKRCAACGAAFECAGLWFCWCRTVSLDEPARRELRNTYSDCLCPECLKAHARPDAASVPVDIRRVTD